jgi:hypothetical protein
LLQLAGRTLWETQVEGKSLRWAEERFQKEAKRFNFQPKSPFLSLLYQMISQLGSWILWFNQNRKKMQSFWTGLIFLVLVTVILIGFSWGAIDFKQITSLFQKSSGK